MTDIKVTMPLGEYEEMKRKASERDIHNFIHKEYTDVERNKFKLVIDQKAVEKFFGTDVKDYTPNLSDVLIKNLHMLTTLKDISETPITRGISPVEMSLARVVNKANQVFREVTKMTDERDVNNES